MKVLQINSHYNQGGAARIAACIHRQLLADGVESYVAYGRGGVSKEENVYRFDHPWEVYLSVFLSRVTGINGWFNKGATGRLIRYMQRIRPDVVHLHALHGYYLNWPRLFQYLNEQRIPVVWTFHDCHAFVGNCGYFFACDRWKEGCGKCPHLREYPASYWFDFTARMWKEKRELFTKGEDKVIVSPSDWLTECAKQSFFGRYPCITIRNGIDTEKTFYPREKERMRKKYGYQKDEKIVLGIAVGYKDPRKGAKYIIQAAKDLEKEAKVILIGWEECSNDMLQDVNNVITLPTTADTAMLAEYYSMADVFVIPSLAENYATTALEAMACGTPVVGFFVGGIPEQLIDGKGIAVEAGNQEAFTKAVKAVLSGEIFVLRGEKLAEKIRNENSTMKMTDAYKEVYQQLVEINDKR